MGMPDSRSAGRSERVPYVPGEDPKDRHARRYGANLAAVQDMRAWCEGRQIYLTIGNGGHHWQFRLPDKRTVEWWPSSAKLVVNRAYDKGIHVHDIEQTQREIERAMGIEPATE